MVSVGQQHVVQSSLQARLGSAPEQDVVRKGPVHVCQEAGGCTVILCKLNERTLIKEP